MLYPRTDNQCWRRWKALDNDEVEAYRQTIYKRKKGLVKNFVGREKERPELDAEDFEIEPEELKKTSVIKKKTKRRRSDEVLESETDDISLGEEKCEEPIDKKPKINHNPPETNPLLRLPRDLADDLPTRVTVPILDHEIGLYPILPATNKTTIAFLKLQDVIEKNHSASVSTLSFSDQKGVDFQQLSGWFNSLFTSTALALSSALQPKSLT